MPPDEQAAASTMFNAADTDRNGVLDREELCALCRQLGFPNESVVDVVDGFLRRFAASEDSETLGRNGFVALYAMLRDDQDSRLQAFRDRQARDAREHAERTRARLQRLAASASEAPEQGVPSTLQASADDLSEVEKRAAELMFKQADSNGNGSIDDTELLALCRRLGFAGDDATALATKTMKLSDRDNDGKLNFDEFLMLYAALYAQQESQKQQVESKIEEMAEEASRRTQTRVALKEDPRFLEKDLAFRAKSARQKTQLRVSARRASGQLTEIEQHAAAMMFDQADTDHNEWIDAEELQSLCVRLGFSHPELPDVVGRLMSQFDSGATGRLSRKDFMGLYAMLRVEEAQKLATFQAQTALNAEEHVNRTKQRVLNRKLHPDFEAKRRQRAQNEAEARHKAEQEALEMLSASEKSAALAMFEVADVDCNGWIDRKELRDLCLKLNFLDNEVDGVVSDFLARFGDASEELSKEAFLSMYAMLRKSESLRLDAYNQQMLEAAADHQQRTQARLERLANADDTELGSFQGHDGPETGPVALDSDSESTLSSSSTALSDQGKIRRCRTMRVELTSAQCRKVLATASNASVQLAKFLQVNLAESGAGRTLVSTALQTMFEVLGMALSSRVDTTYNRKARHRAKIWLVDETLLTLLAQALWKLANTAADRQWTSMKGGDSTEIIKMQMLCTGVFHRAVLFLQDVLETQAAPEDPNFERVSFPSPDHLVSLLRQQLARSITNWFSSPRMKEWEQEVGAIDAHAPLRGMSDQYLGLCLENTLSLEVVALVRGTVQALTVRRQWPSVFQDDFCIDPTSATVQEEGKTSRSVKKKTPRGRGEKMGAIKVSSHDPILTPRSRPQTVRQIQDQDSTDTFEQESYRIENLSRSQSAFLCALLSALSGMGAARVSRHVSSLLSRQYHQCVGGMQPDPSGFFEMLSFQGVDPIGHLDVGAADANAATVVSQLSQAAAQFARGLHSDDLVEYLETAWHVEGDALSEACVLAAQHLLRQLLRHRASHRENAWPALVSPQKSQPSSREETEKAIEQANLNFGENGTAAANDEVNSGIVFFDNDHKVDEADVDYRDQCLRKRRAQIWKLIGFDFVPKDGFDTVMERKNDAHHFSSTLARLHNDRPHSAGHSSRLKLQLDARQPARPATATAGIVFEAPPPLFGNDVVNSASGVG
eukprot:INCI12797.1.p1 GENE.INCI12797.1~~INCI12797.1.p1  ORF type:complete len:1376 (-),score=294.36 INCI12797.1:26-3553(-)